MMGVTKATRRISFPISPFLFITFILKIQITLFLGEVFLKRVTSILAEWIQDHAENYEANLNFDLH